MKENTKLLLNVVFWCLAVAILLLQGLHTTTTDLLVALALFWWNLHNRFRTVEGQLDRIERKLEAMGIATIGGEAGPPAL